MDKKTILQFNEDRTECKVVFKSGAESITYNYKGDLISALIDMATKGKITPDELEGLINEAIPVKSFKFDEAGNEPEISFTREQRSVPMPDIMGSLEMLLMMSMLMPPTAMDEFLSMSKNPPKEAGFKMCKCGGKHGWIYTTKGMISNKITSKEMGAATVDFLMKENLINKDEVKKLLKEIDKSSLPKK